MKYPTLIILLMLLSSCGQASPLDSIVSISGYQGSREVIHGMGACIDADTVLTSAHVVRDDRVNYQLRIINYELPTPDVILLERDLIPDIAYLGTRSDICQNPREYIGKTDSLRIGDNISIPVIRSGSIVALTGAITSLTGSRIGYDSIGRTQVLSGLILTDISLSPGDSGAPILDDQGRVIDVVHVAD